MDVSKNSGTPKPSILIGFSIINHPFWGAPISGNTHIVSYAANLTREALACAPLPCRFDLQRFTPALATSKWTFQLSPRWTWRCGGGRTRGGAGILVCYRTYLKKVTYNIYIIYICFYFGGWLLLIWHDVFLFVPFFGYDDVIVRGNSDFRDIDKRVHCTLLTQKQGEIFLFVLQQVSKDQCLGGLWNHAESVM